MSFALRLVNFSSSNQKQVFKLKLRMSLKDTCFLQTLLLILLSVGVTTGLPAELADLDHDSASGEGYYVDPERAKYMLRVRNFAVQGYIVGGRPALEGEAPYQLSLMRRRKHVCGATLILAPFSQSRQIAVTAAHCICKKSSSNPNDLREYSVRGGSRNKFAGQTLYVQKFVIHENYEGKFLDDIALIFLEGKFDLGRTLDVLELPDKNMQQPDYVTVSGWGSIRENGQSVTDLQIVSLPVIDNEECEERYRDQYPGMQMINSKSMCTLIPEGGKDACKGD